MKIINLSTNTVYELEFKQLGENKGICPSCSNTRKKSNLKCFSFNVDLRAGYCNHCDGRFVEYKPFEEKKKYTIPQFENKTNLDDKSLQYLTNRFINQSVIAKMGIFSKLEFMPQRKTETNDGISNCIVFPFFKNGLIFNTKFRDGAKNFKLYSGAEVNWYNYDAISHNTEIIITEGEIDTLSFMSCGFDNVISVPNGANPNLPFLKIEDFDKIEKVYLAVDNDVKGIALRDELIRRLGDERCYLVSFKEFKDANEYLCANGHNSLQEVIKNAKEPKVDGIFTADNFIDDIQAMYQVGMQKGMIIDVPDLDNLISWETKRLSITTGTPSSGKSEFIDFKAVKLNLKYGMKWAIWSPENFPIHYHYSKLAEKISGKKFSEKTMSADLFWSSYEHIKSNFFWVDSEDYSLDNILKKFKFLVKKYGVKGCILDPFGSLSDEVMYNEQGKILDKIRAFARKCDVLFELVAHPKKLEKNKEGTYPMPTMYDIAGTNEFWNKADYGIALGRNFDADKKEYTNEGVLAVHKVKFKHLGNTGKWEWKYNYNNGRYEHIISNINQWDNESWIKKPNSNFDNGMQNKYDEEAPF